MLHTGVEVLHRNRGMSAGLRGVTHRDGVCSQEFGVRYTQQRGVITGVVHRWVRQEHCVSSERVVGAGDIQRV